MTQAGPLAIVGNSHHSTVTIIDTPVTSTASPSHVTVTATIPRADAQGPINPVGGIAANPLRAEVYIAALTSDGVPVLTVFGTNPPTQLAQIPLRVFEPIGVAVNPAGTRVYVS